MLSSSQNNRIAESKRRFGADKPLLDSLGHDTTWQALQSYLITGWVVPPFHVNKNVQRPWIFDSPPQALGTVEADIHRELQAATEARILPTYQRIGIALSGGLDSTIIASLCRGILDRHQLMAFTLDFGPPWSVEVEVATRIAKQLDMPLFVIDASPNTILSNIYAATSAMKSPYGDAVCVPWYLLGKAASDAGCNALFSGEGGDQVFGGWANKPMIAELALNASSLADVYARTFHRFLDGMPAMLGTDYCNNALAFDAHQWIRTCLPTDNSSSLLQTLRHLNFATKGGGTILPRFTELVEAHGIDSHAPFFDTDLLAAATALPDNAILDNSLDKAVLRRLVSKLTSPDIAELPKRGMGVPATFWTTDRHALSRTVHKKLHKRNRHRDQRICQVAIDELISGIVDAPDAYRKRRLGERIWTLFQWEVFREVHSLSE